MPMNAVQLRSRQLVAWAIAGVFVFGFVNAAVGMWTGTILAVWLVGTQRPARGFLWLAAMNLLLDLPGNLRAFPRGNLHEAVGFLAGTVFALVLSILPFTFHRLVSPRLPGFLSTLPLPFASVALRMVIMLLMPSRFGMEISADRFLIAWFAAAIVWMWNRECGLARITAVTGIAAALVLASHLAGSAPVGGKGSLQIFGWICVGVTMALVAWAFRRGKMLTGWAGRPEIALLQSPYSGNSVHAEKETGREILKSSSGERFPIRNGIPEFLKPEDVTGSNLKYNHLYETIGGFYDDTQRVGCALTAMDRDAYVMSYLGLLEVKAGDWVLETSVGTGLNFKYLPRDIQRFGLDLSPEMLVNCRGNFNRWGMGGDLFLGNAETLPFADNSFDVVFHVGGINFFNDRAKAIREMIRVAKPGSLLLVADETEKHVKNAYEKIPYTSHFFKGRKEPVTAPADLIPAELCEISLKSIFNDRFYALTFRKPALS